jgi:curli biogenesis system outer membrane secretion channel CsgG
MFMKRLILCLIMSSLLLFLNSCISHTIMGGGSTVATGAAGGATAQGENPTLEKCSNPLGTVAIIEDTNAAWYRILTGQYKLGSVTPVIRMLIQQSNCFVVVERGIGLESGVMKERQLMEAGELRKSSNFKKGQLVAADYTVSPSITFSEGDTSKIGGALGAVGGGLLGAIAGAISTKEASVTLLLIDNRSGVQVAASEGSAKTYDIGGLGALFGSNLGGIGGGYANTPEGKVLVTAFLDAYNKLVKAVKNYKMQIREGGLGTGGELKVQEEIPTSQDTISNKKDMIESKETVQTQKVPPKQTKTKQIKKKIK